ncbi:MAG: PaaI family thioesterase [Minwuia sp.]|uniref:PaaI family thioesterase n=1 Tax=Minwuia sp. TaxID=2493630 RepID=UPI003A8B4ACF
MNHQPMDAARIKEILTNRPLAPASQMLGFHVLDIDPDRGYARVGYLAKPDFCNPLGVIQGGFLTAMVDEAMAVACVSMARFSIFIPTLELKVSFLRAGYPGPMTAEGQVVRMGKSVAFLEGSLFDEKGELLIRASATGKVTPKDKVQAAKAAREREDSA